MRQSLLTLVVLLSLLHSSLAQTQQPAAIDQDDVVKITTNLVQIDAVVLKNGKPVKDLKQEDFEIFQDGRRQEIVSFAYISNEPNYKPAPVPTEKGKSVLITPSQPVRANETRRTMALIVDDLGLSFDSITRLRAKLRKLVDEQLGPNDLVGIIRTGGTVGPLQQFTNDKRLLHQAIDQLRYNTCSRIGVDVFSSPRDLGISLCQADPKVSLNALGFIVESMGYLPGRKSAIVFSDSVPVEEQELDFTGGGVNSTTLANSSDTNIKDFDSPKNYSSLLRRVAERAIRASVVIYTVDAKGLISPDITAKDSRNAGSVRELINQSNSTYRARSAFLLDSRGGAELIARQTGGYLVFNSNSMELDRIVEDQSGYYLIGYRPAEETFNKKFHKVTARVTKSGMTVRTRNGFYGITEEDAKTAKPLIADKMTLALVSPFGAQEIPLDLTAFFAQNPNGSSIIRSVVQLKANDVQFKESPEGNRVATMEFRTALIGNNGEIVDKQAIGKTITLSKAKYQQALREGFSVVLETPVKKAGAYQLRVAARDEENWRLGAAGQYVSAPDLGNGRLAISGIVLQPEPEIDLTLNPLVKKLVTGTTTRFNLAVYNAAKGVSGTPNVSLQARLAKEDKVIYTSPSIAVDVANQNGPRLLATGTFRLNADLEAGSYALQVIVTDNNTKEKSAVMQWLNFEVIK